MKRKHFSKIRVMGQNFLKDDNAAERIAQLSAGLCLKNKSSEREVIEIGGGKGALTQHLFSRFKHIAVIEPDPKLVTSLYPMETFCKGTFLVIHKDFFDIEAQDIPFDNPVIVGNLPYRCSLPIFFRLLEGDWKWQGMVLMFQKEVAARLTARPGNKKFSGVSLRSGLLASVQARFDLPPSAFHPEPKVHSSVVIVTPRPSPLPPEEMAAFISFCSPFFPIRRKKIIDALKIKFSFEIAMEGLKQADIEPEARPFEIDEEGWIRLWREMRSFRTS